jgi:hypothetical protein
MASKCPCLSISAVAPNFDVAGTPFPSLTKTAESLGFVQVPTPLTGTMYISLLRLHWRMPAVDCL